MSETTDRIPCPHCGASNFPTSAVCWQCGRALRAEAQPPGGTPPTPPPPGMPPPAYPMPAPSQDTRTLVILGFVFAALTLCCCPLFGIAGIILGIIVLRRGNPIGTWIIVLCTILTIVSIAASVAYFTWIARHPELFKQGGIQKYPFPMPGQ